MNAAQGAFRAFLTRACTRYLEDQEGEDTRGKLGAYGPKMAEVVAAVMERDGIITKEHLLRLSEHSKILTTVLTEHSSILKVLLLVEAAATEDKAAAEKLNKFMESLTITKATPTPQINGELSLARLQWRVVIAAE